jgi:hypothetical protein
MFLALDECKHGKNVLGLLALPLDQVADFERAFCALRLEKKTMGEIGWTCISKPYLKKYLSFVDLFLENPDATFHAMTYSEGRKYHAGYSLIRVVSRKMWNAGMHMNRELFILFDQDTDAFPSSRPLDVDRGGEEREFSNAYDAIKKIAARDGGFIHRITYCNQGASHQFGILQIADILTGAMNAVVNNRSDMSEEHTILINHIREAIGHEFDASKSELSIPALNAYKLHFLDPVARSQNSTTR